ncbi:MAG: TonB-dependent receptor [Spirochaetes bacterium]|nr:TonB-dependent receptor [Spirochaetota bacterium]
MKKIFLFMISGLVLTCMSTLAVFGEESKDAVVSLSDVVITESKIPDSIKYATEKIVVVSEKDIEKKTAGKKNISELLMYEAGSAVSVLSRNDANWGAFGGLGPTYNVFLLDGLPIDSFVDTMTLDPWIIKRIEAYRGPASVLYNNYQSQDFAGNQSPLAGITNIVLKDKIEKPATRLSAGVGSWWTHQYAAYHQGRNSELNYFFGGFMERSRYTDYGTENSWLNMKDNPQYMKNRLYGMLSYFFNDANKISIFAHHTQHAGDTGRINRRYDHVYDVINAECTLGIASGTTLQIKGGLRRYDRRWDEDGGGSTQADFDLESQNGVLQNIVPVDASVNIRHLGKSLFTIGVDNQFGNYRTFLNAESNNWIRQTQNDAWANATGVYIQEKVVFADNLILRAGFRYNRIHHEYETISGGEPGINDASWNVFLWSGGFVYHILQYLTVYANAGSSYRVPGIKSIAGTIPESDFGVPGRDGQLPNPDLKPESGLSIDLGSDVNIANMFTLGIRGFYTTVEDTIVDNVVSLTPSQTKSINAGEVVSYGAEVEGKVRAFSYLHAFANYTYIFNEISNDASPQHDGSKTPFVPTHLANCGIMYDLPQNLLAALYAHYHGAIYDSSDKTSRKKLDDYLIVNAKIVKSLIATRDVSVNLIFEAENLTNKRYEMPWQFQDPGRAFFGRVEIIF